MKFSFSIASAFCAIIAAALWYKASVVIVKPDKEPKPDSSGMLPYEMTKTDGDKTCDVFATAKAQTKWNKWAALAACFAAAFQALSIIF